MTNKFCKLGLHKYSQKVKHGLFYMKECKICGIEKAKYAYEGQWFGVNMRVFTTFWGATHLTPFGMRHIMKKMKDER